MASVKLGAKVPKFSIPATDGLFRMGAPKDENLVVYFYPRDNTPGCTQEGESFTGNFAQFKKAGSMILGISADSVESHEKFKKKMGFPFDLLSDPEQRVCKLYDVIQEKSMYGKKYMGIERSSFLIDAKGVLRQEWRKVKVNGHAEAVLAAVKAL